MYRYIPILLLFTVSVISCKSGEIVTDPPPDVEDFYDIASDIEKDQEIEAWLSEFREIYETEMGRPVAYANGPLELGQPESSLGNLAADMLRYRAIHEYQRFVHIGLLNLESFQLEFDAGNITLGDLYELMPYNNTLVVLEMDGDHVRELADEIAQKGGVPLSGMRMTITDNQASSVLIDSGSLDRDATYLVATSSYLADGNGDFPSLRNGNTRYDYPILIRDIIIDYMRSRRVFEPVEDLRIRSR
jgi:2',3'-cyclic-nucleotide 2'-phosphodiesterase (5'-nucleotidase family)